VEAASCSPGGPGVRHFISTVKAGTERENANGGERNFRPAGMTTSFGSKLVFFVQLTSYLIGERL
jgi:hypothetical protein